MHGGFISLAKRCFPDVKVCVDMFVRQVWLRYAIFMFSSISDPLKPLILRDFLDVCHQFLEKSRMYWHCLMAETSRAYCRGPEQKKEQNKFAPKDRTILLSLRNNLYSQARLDCFSIRSNSSGNNLISAKMLKIDFLVPFGLIITCHQQSVTICDRIKICAQTD